MIEGTSLFVGMFNNLAVFIVFMFLYGLIKPRNMGHYRKSLSLGLLFALTLLVCMLVRIPVAPGVLVDQRNGIIVLSTLFAGPLSGLITMTAGIIMRMILGGSGVLAGIIGMGLSLSAGLLLRRWKRERHIPFFFLGSLIAVIIILPGFLFVGDLANGWNLLKRMAIPYGTALYTGIIFVGFLLQHEENRLTTAARLKESENKYRSLYENLLDISYSVDREGYIKEISPSVKTVLGYEPENIINSHTIELYVDKEDRRNLYETLERDGILKDYEVFLYKRNGEIARVSINAVLDYDGSGRRSGYHGIIRDITELFQARKEKDSLEKIVYQTQKMEALGTLAGGVAHDFNNILAAVLGFAELIRNNADNGESVREFADQILQAADRATGLIRQILLFSRETTSKMERLEIDSLIGEVANLLNQTIPKTVKINFINYREKLSVRADSNQLHQVILNLATNAFHALPEEQGEITLSLDKTVLSEEEGIRRGLKAGEYLLFSIGDNGKGIAEKDRPYIFDPFFTTKERGKGTGLGLSVVHGIIRKHEGEISFESEVGKGTTFTILLPLSGEEGDGSPDRKDTREEDLPGGTERIMILDDEESIAQMEKFMLSSLGYEISMYTDALMAREALLNQPERYDLLITDQSMPGISGIMLAEEILKTRKDFPIIIATGYSSVLKSQEAEKMGVKNILIKPLSQKKLARTVRETLDS